MSFDTFAFGVLNIVMVAIWGPKILLAYVVLFAYLLIAHGVVRGGEWLWARVRRPSAGSSVWIDDERDAAVRDLIALRHRAVREMVEISRDDFIEGTAREVRRR